MGPGAPPRSLGFVFLCVYFHPLAALLLWDKVATTDQALHRSIDSLQVLSKSWACLSASLRVTGTLNNRCAEREHKTGWAGPRSWVMMESLHTNTTGWAEGTPGTTRAFCPGGAAGVEQTCHSPHQHPQVLDQWTPELALPNFRLRASHHWLTSAAGRVFTPWKWASTSNQGYNGPREPIATHLPAETWCNRLKLQHPLTWLLHSETSVNDSQWTSSSAAVKWENWVLACQGCIRSLPVWDFQRCVYVCVYVYTNAGTFEFKFLSCIRDHKSRHLL